MHPEHVTFRDWANCFLILAAVHIVRVAIWTMIEDRWPSR